jgi:hypothetical protein
VQFYKDNDFNKIVSNLSIVTYLNILINLNQINKTNEDEQKKFMIQNAIPSIFLEMSQGPIMEEGKILANTNIWKFQPIGKDKNLKKIIDNYLYNQQTFNEYVDMTNSTLVKANKDYIEQIPNFYRKILKNYTANSSRFTWTTRSFNKELKDFINKTENKQGTVIDLNLKWLTINLFSANRLAFAIEHFTKNENDVLEDMKQIKYIFPELQNQTNMINNLILMETTLFCFFYYKVATISQQGQIVSMLRDGRKMIDILCSMETIYGKNNCEAHNFKGRSLNFQYVVLFNCFSYYAIQSSIWNTNNSDHIKEYDIGGDLFYLYHYSPLSCDSVDKEQTNAITSWSPDSVNNLSHFSSSSIRGECLDRAIMGERDKIFIFNDKRYYFSPYLFISSVSEYKAENEIIIPYGAKQIDYTESIGKISLVETTKFYERYERYANIRTFYLCFDESEYKNFKEKTTFNIDELNDFYEFMISEVTQPSLYATPQSEGGPYGRYQRITSIELNSILDRILTTFTRTWTDIHPYEEEEEEQKDLLFKLFKKPKIVKN